MRGKVFPRRFTHIRAREYLRDHGNRSRFSPQNGQNSTSVFAEIGAQGLSPKLFASIHIESSAMKKDFGTFSVVIGGIVALAAALFIFSGGEFGGKKTIEGDEDLPPIATTDR
ncbi:MAG TPA: hypothetical protein VG986_17895 [Pseudolabrys sp.]|nr:hypothetical protein [Pseudolabrys sp.]